jgi:SAM-dependent methyltransferase
MDGDLPYQEARRALTDLDRVTRWLLGTGSLVRTLARRLSAPPRGGSEEEAPLRVLDLGTGSGRPAAVLARAARRRGARLRVVGVDLRLGHLLVGRALGNGQQRVVASAEALPFRDGAFDWAFSTLFFHHFGGRENLAILGEMRRAARRGVAVIDLRRSRLAVTLARLLFPILGVGRVARHDGYLSIAQSWTRAEVAELVGRVGGLEIEELRRRFPFRWSLVVRADEGPADP